MFVFIFESIDNLTDSYHSDGGLVVIAPDVATARALAEARGVSFTEQEIASVKSYQLASREEETRVFIFPDAGCC